VVVAVGAILLFTAATGVASAHGVTTTRFDAPLPLPLLFGGAGATVALTAIWLGAVAGSDVRQPRNRWVLPIPVQLLTAGRTVLRVGFTVAVAVVLATGVAGRQVAATNFATVFTWPVWFRGVALLAVLVGNVWPMLSPWRTVHTALSRLEGRKLVLLERYPNRLGTWPALVGFLVLIGIVENLTVIPRSPRLTAVLVALYALVMVSGAVLWGQTWLERADPLGVLYRLLARVAPLEFDVGDETRSVTVTVRAPWVGCLDPVRGMPLVAFIIATVYTVSFDGFTNTQLFQTVLFDIRGVFGTGPGTSVFLYIAGLVGFVGAFAVCSWLVERFGAGTGRSWRGAARSFAPTVLPIAAAYEVAHNYPYVARNLGQLVPLVFDPILPSVGPVQPLGWLSIAAFWGTQVGLIVIGHVVGVVAAHYVAVDRYDSVAAARRGHLPLVGLMICYTVLSLWIVSQPVVAG
jgi:hypothetical protein